METTPPTPPVDQKVVIDQGRARKNASQSTPKLKNRKRKVDFTPDDAMNLLDIAENILDIESDDCEEAWEVWAKAVSSSIHLALAGEACNSSVSGNSGTNFQLESRSYCRTMARLL